MLQREKRQRYTRWRNRKLSLGPWAWSYLTLNGGHVSSCMQSLDPGTAPARTPLCVSSDERHRNAFCLVTKVSSSVTFLRWPPPKLLKAVLYFFSFLFLTIAKRLDSIWFYVTRYFLASWKYRFCFTDLCKWWYNPKHKHFNKTLRFFECKSSSGNKEKNWMTDVAFVRSISVLHGENSIPTLFFSGRLYPRKGSQTPDLRFWRTWIR